MSQPSRRGLADRCPGVFSTHEAADGAVARVRLPGGRIGPDQLTLLAQAAAAHGDGFLELTARANLQLRGIGDVDAVAEAVIEAGLAPSSTHDKVRNIEVSPLTGRIGGIADVAPVAEALDSRLRTEGWSAELSGRFLFGVDDGRGDIRRHRPDVCALVRSVDGPDIVADILVDDEPVGSARGVEMIVDALLDVAHMLVESAPGTWRIGDLTPDERSAVEERMGTRLPPAVRGPGDAAPDDAAPDGAPAVGEPIVGWFDQDDGRVLLGAVVELGRIPARLAEFIAAVEAPVIITPDREILICDLGEGVAETVVRVLAPMGLIFDATSPWARVSCCVGAPGCANATAPVREDLLAHVRDGEAIGDREHWVGCPRGCGSPAVPHERVVADPDGGYRTHRR
ncbi:precorrin-3B synthase [Gordonia sp. ABSL11-1]|uniref:precorrin-3B synthase n=1 Tax=Gordonia sp. ABSL11-1 TaxID=3053924 RepID=UPI0025734B5C|nr:precorrin-3B synthase [Gordonia sp. ABSL11-1]MDL9946162.1 precorrin-3B synthase [Gordonia sp. ABSL11-1]